MTTKDKLLEELGKETELDEVSETRRFYLKHLHETIEEMSEEQRGKAIDAIQSGERFHYKGENLTLSI